LASSWEQGERETVAEEVVEVDKTGIVDLREELKH